MVVELKAHQQEAVDKLDYGKILYGGVGSGKTITSLAFFYTKVMGGVLNDPHSIRRPKRVIVITTAKVRDSLDWQKTASWFSISTDEECSLPGVTITVDSWNNIGKYTEVEDAFFVFDEQRLVGSGAWVKSFLKIAKSNGWILLSATPGDTWFDYLPVFIANGFFKNKTEFSREHVVWTPYTKFPKVQRYVGVNKLVKLKNKVLVEMPFERHTIRDVVDYMVDYDMELFNKVVKERWHPFEERPIRDVAELFLVMRKVVNSDVSRAEAVRRLWRKHPKLIVFYNFDYELMELRKLAENPPSPLRMVSSHPSSTPAPTSSGSTTGGSQAATELASLKDLGETECAPSEATSGTEVSTSPANSRSQTRSTSASSETLSPSTSASGHPRPSSSTPTPADQANLASTSGQTNSLTAANSTHTASVAEWNGHKHEPIPDTDQWLYLVQYQAGAEGWNCVETDAMVFYSLTYSYKNFMQAQGRIDRLNTPFKHLKYYVLMTTSVIDKAVRRSLNEKKDFNERKFIEKHERKAA